MNKTRYAIRLTDQEMGDIQHMLHAGIHAARALNRARILLSAHEGASDTMIAEAVGVCLATVFNTRRRYCTEGLQAVLTEKPRPGHPPKLDGHGEARLTALACSDAPEGHARWTLRLLADRLVDLDVVDAVSHTTVRRLLKKTT